MHAIRLTGGEASCRIADDGALVHPLTGEPDPTLGERELMIYGMKAGYGVRGAKIGSDGDQAERFNEDMLTFWQAAMAV
jgi:hypothetical protein